MLVKEVTYKDFNDVERTEKFYFNLTKAELTEMELSKAGGLTGKIEKIIEAKDGAEIIKLFKEVILLSYGEKSPDGKRFMKGPEISQAFMETNAYSIIFMEIALDADKAAAFIEGLIPPDLRPSDN